MRVGGRALEVACGARGDGHASAHDRLPARCQSTVTQVSTRERLPMKGFLHGLARCTLVLFLIMLAVILTGCRPADWHGRADGGRLRSRRGAVRQRRLPASRIALQYHVPPGRAARRRRVPTCRGAAGHALPPGPAAARRWHLPEGGRAAVGVRGRLHARRRRRVRADPPGQPVPHGADGRPWRHRVSRCRSLREAAPGQVSPSRRTPSSWTRRMRGEQRWDPGSPVDQDPGWGRRGGDRRDRGGGDRAYNEDVVIQGKPVRLWGRCPAMVEVAGTGMVPVGAVEVVGEAARQCRDHGVGVTGPGDGIGGAGIERLRDRASMGARHGESWRLDVEDDLGLPAWC